MHPRIHWFISDPSPVLTKKESVAHYRLDSGDSLRFDTDSHISIADSLDIVKDKYSNVLKNQWTQSLPVEGGSLREPLANDLLMYWTEQNWCAHGLAQTKSIPLFHKSFARLFQKPRSPRSPHPPGI